MAGGFHSTSPFHHNVAFVANVTSKLPSALKSLPIIILILIELRPKGERFSDGFNLLIVQHNVGSPNVVGRYVQLFDSSILIGLPYQFVIIPELQEVIRL